MFLKKFDIENDFQKYVKILAPDNDIKGIVKTISQLIRFFPNITFENAQKTNDEWRELCHTLILNNTV